MKTKTTTVIEKIFNSAFITLSSLGLSYSLINNFILDKPNKDMLLIMICLFFASIASWQRKK
ncbi:hypothetical protein [Flavobacterium pectinovorum]|uniref:hypothetical protein n=1 Tax=Flavobacterium pectinovorum TaxID=29533 RepID=UPI001FAC9C08|nr:hypothetical protein [Flavobacterium pectinovorum]MCI9844404.1 hypothetical protein [Flavobacterium pectinovorum]